MALLKVKLKGAKTGEEAAAGCGCLSIVLLFNLLVGGFLTEYVLETWLPLILDKPVDVPFWACVLVGLFLAEPMLGLAILTWIIALAGVI